MYRLSCKGPPCFQLPRKDEASWIEANINPAYTTTLSYVWLFEGWEHVPVAVAAVVVVGQVWVSSGEGGGRVAVP
jgi:hypothetical protein